MNAKKTTEQGKRVRNLRPKELAGGHAKTVRGGSRKMLGVSKWPNLVLKQGSTGN